MKAVCLAASAASRQPLRRRICVIVECAGKPSSPKSCNRRRSLRPPHAGCSPRSETILASTASAVRFGLASGRRERSERSEPSASPRPSHLYPVFRLIPNRRQSSETFEPSREAKLTNSRRNSTMDLETHDMTRLQSRNLCGKCVTPLSEHLLPISPVHTKRRGGEKSGRSASANLPLSSLAKTGDDRNSFTSAPV